MNETVQKPSNRAEAWLHGQGMPAEPATPLDWIVEEYKTSLGKQYVTLGEVIDHYAMELCINPDDGDKIKQRILDHWKSSTGSHLPNKPY